MKCYFFARKIVSSDDVCITLVGPGRVTRTLCLHTGVQPANLLASRPERLTRPLPAQLHAGVADGVLQPLHGIVCSSFVAHASDLLLHGEFPFHCVLSDWWLCYQFGQHVARQEHVTHSY